MSALPMDDNTFRIKSCSMSSMGYSGEHAQAVACMVNGIFKEIYRENVLGLSSSIGNLTDAVGQAVSGITTNITGGQEVGGRF